jgi:hypothetical protein
VATVGVWCEVVLREGTFLAIRVNRFVFWWFIVFGPYLCNKEAAAGNNVWWFVSLVPKPLAQGLIENLDSFCSFRLSPV